MGDPKTSLPPWAPPKKKRKSRKTRLLVKETLIPFCEKKLNEKNVRYHNDYQSKASVRAFFNGAGRWLVQEIYKEMEERFFDHEIVDTLTTLCFVHLVDLTSLKQQVSQGGTLSRKSLWDLLSEEI